jgi:hypothetical protein
MTTQTAFHAAVTTQGSYVRGGRLSEIISRALCLYQATERYGMTPPVSGDVRLAPIETALREAYTATRGRDPTTACKEFAFAPAAPETLRTRTDVGE